MLNFQMLLGYFLFSPPLPYLYCSVAGQEINKREPLVLETCILFYLCTFTIWALLLSTLNESGVDLNTSFFPILIERKKKK